MAHITISLRLEKGNAKDQDLVLLSRAKDLEAIYDKIKAFASKEFKQ